MVSILHPLFGNMLKSEEQEEEVRVEDVCKEAREREREREREERRGKMCKEVKKLGRREKSYKC